MKHLALLLLCVWALLEPPYKGMTPILDAPFKEWTIATFARKAKAVNTYISIPAYYDTEKDCEKQREKMTELTIFGYGEGIHKVCLPVNPVLTGVHQNQPRGLR